METPKQIAEKALKAREELLMIEAFKEIDYLVYVCKPGTPEFSDEPAKHIGQKSFILAVANIVKAAKKEIKTGFDAHSRKYP